MGLYSREAYMQIYIISVNHAGKWLHSIALTGD